MKKTTVLAALVITITLTNTLYAQHPDANKQGGGLYPAAINDAGHPCIQPEEYKHIEVEIAENLKKLHLQKTENKTTATLFGWPLAPAAGMHDCSYYFITNYIDEDATTGIKDYNCGSVTYDGHRGTDIGSLPYGFLKMNNNLVTAVAAAPGTIVQKSDGYFDKNCAMGSDTANSIIIQHADGSLALYWHFKKNSLTTKIVGQTVALGEFLGVVGSSGSSTGPHLHFEVWSNTSSSSLRDPWAGTCNYYGGTTLWTAQKPYTEPAVIEVQTNSIPLVIPTCPGTEIPNEDTCFAAGTTSARFYMFVRNETMGDTIFQRIIKPDGTTFSSWNHNCTTSYLGSYWWQTMTLPTVTGLYTYEAKYRGVACTKKFRINCGTLSTSGIAEKPSVVITPNPAKSSIAISGYNFENGTYRLTVKNILGQTVSEKQLHLNNSELNEAINIASLANGIYFLQIESPTIRFVEKFVKQE